MTDVLYLTEQDVRKTMGIQEVVELATVGIDADAAGDVSGDKFYMPVGDDGFVKPFSGYMKGSRFNYVKWFGFFEGNVAKGLPTTSSMAALMDAETGETRCLMDANWITAAKTGASTAITIAQLARSGPNTVGLVGAGQLGRTHLEALACVADLGAVRIFDINAGSAQAAAAEMRDRLGVPVTAASSEETVSESDVVITVTTGNDAVVRAEWVRPGAFIAKMGSFQELDLGVFDKVDKVVVDAWRYVGSRVPEFVALAAQGRFGESDVYAEWPDIRAGKVPGREHDDETILYVALGIFGEYASVLPDVFERALEMGLGTWLSRAD